MVEVVVGEDKKGIVDGLLKVYKEVFEISKKEM